MSVGMNMDMLDLKFENETFDVVIDKCAMDALLVTRKDPWDPEEELLSETAKYLNGVSRVLKPGGIYMQISFDQPHFRKLFLNHPDKFNWSFEYAKFGGGFGYFLYIMRKHQDESK
jgi:SAM-dependent methyltransferase